MTSHSSAWSQTESTMHTPVLSEFLHKALHCTFTIPSGVKKCSWLVLLQCHADDIMLKKKLLFIYTVNCVVCGSIAAV